MVCLQYHSLLTYMLTRRRLGAALGWCYSHLHLFLVMQRLGLIPGSKWFPGYKFFIPFTSEWPVATPAPIGSYSITSIGGWLNRLALNMAPYAAFYLSSHISNLVHMHVWPHVNARLPKPARSELYSLQRLPVERRPTIPDNEWHTVPESPTLGAADREIRHGGISEQDVPTLQALEGQPTGAGESGIPLGAIRRQSTFSSRGGDQDYGTDEEDADMVNPTLISFDVDTSDSNEQPAGVWSAELRPSYGGDGPPPSLSQPVYMVNPLTSLPSVLATDILTNFITFTFCAPFDTLAIRSIARAFAERSGLSTASMYQARLLDGLGWRNVGNLVGLEVVRLLISGELWAITSIFSQWFHVTEEEWREFHKEEQEERERERENREQIAREQAARLEAVAAEVEADV